MGRRKTTSFFFGPFASLPDSPLSELCALCGEHFPAPLPKLFRRILPGRNPALHKTAHMPRLDPPGGTTSTSSGFILQSPPGKIFSTLWKIIPDFFHTVENHSAPACVNALRSDSRRLFSEYLPLDILRRVRRAARRPSPHQNISSGITRLRD